MKNTFSFLSLFLVALLTSFPVLSAVQVSATVSDNNVVVGDLFILTVSINDNDDDYRLDTRSLEHDFTVYRPSQSQSSEYVNGNFSQKTQWKVRLQAKQTGQYVIPALKIGDHSTKPINIKVTKVAHKTQNSSVKDSVIFIENSINKDNVYVGQSFVFTTKLYISKNTNELDLNAPHFEGAENSVLGQDKTSQTVRNGIRYNTITRQYKMIATQAGKFEIDSPLLSGSVRKVVAVSEWQNRVIAEPINIRGESLNINVQAIPDNYKGDWIVSDNLRLIEDNDLSAQSYKVGEPITRSITLQIASMDKDKLPNINLNYPKSLRVYPDQDQLEEGQANGLNYAIRIIRHAIIADKAGSLILPEITLNWFNSQTNKQQTATLPAQELTILAADKQADISPTIQPTTQQPQPAIIVDNSALIYWQIAVALLTIILLFMVFYHLSYRRSVATSKQDKKVKVAPLNHFYLTLQSNFNKSTASECYSALLNYAQSQYPSLRSLNQLAQKTTLNETEQALLSDQIQYLQLCCSDPSIQWNASKLAELIKKHELTKQSPVKSDPMKINP